jgi:hypothetical protein
MLAEKAVAWEYKTVVFRSGDISQSDEFETSLNLLGMQGWRLISALPHRSEQDKFTFVMMRALRD